MITVARLSSLDALASIAVEWSGLVDRAAGATPFQRPEWLIPWWNRFGSGELHALAFRSECRLVGLIAMFVHEWEGRRQVTLVGNGITDYLDLTAETGTAGECARLTYEYLSANRSLWDICDWQDLPPGSPFIASAPRDLHHTLVDSIPCMRAQMPQDPDAYEQSLPHGLRRTVRIAARRLERDGDLRFETIRADPDAEVVTSLFRLHKDRWAPKGGPSSLLDSPLTQKFLIHATCEFSAAGKLRLYTLRYGGDLVAIIYSILDQGRAWGYITGMDPALSRFSPGSLVLLYAMRDAIGEGASAWEFLRGEEQYKFQWGARTVRKARLILWHSDSNAPETAHAEMEPVLT